MGEAAANHRLLNTCPVLQAGGAAPLVEAVVGLVGGVVALAGWPGLLVVDDVFQVLDAA